MPKERITVEQIESLTQEEKELLRSWAETEELPLLSIGQMIFMLKDHSTLFCLDDYHYTNSEDICDELWNDLKSALHKKLNPIPIVKSEPITMAQMEKVLEANAKVMKEMLSEPNQIFDKIFKRR